MKRTFVLILFVVAAGCASVQPTPEPVHVVIVGTTDVHGWFTGHPETTPAGELTWGGLPLLSSYINALRSEHPDRVIVVDSGDMFQGTLESNLSEGEAMVQGYNAIGYSAAAVGNHEFDFGPAGPKAVALEAGDDPLGALKRNAEIARFPLLSANMVEKATGRTPAWAKRYTIVRAGGASIGIIGLSTPDTPNVTMAVNVASLDFTDPVAATIEAARELREQGVDAIIVIAHIGGRCTEVHDPYSLESCDRRTEAMQLIERLPQGTIDAFFGGHTHSQMRHYVNGVAAAQGLAYSREFSMVDLWIDTAADRVVRSNIRPLTMICSAVFSGTDQCDPRTAPANATLEPRVFAGTTITSDVQVAATVEPYLQRVIARREEKIGVTTAERFNREYRGESPLGNLLADALREATGADIGVMNSGGIRAALPAGELTYGDIFTVSPFDNYPAIVKMTGAEVVELVRSMSAGARGFLQVSGLRYTVDAAKEIDKPITERDQLVSVTLEDGTPLDPQKFYTVAMPDFIAAGGDATDVVMDTIPAERITISYERPVRDAVIEVLQRRQGPLVPSTTGRITVLNRPSE